MMRNSMKDYVRIFNEIKNTSSRVEKENLLKKYEDVEGFKEILTFVYDPLIPSGLAKKKIEKEVSLTTYKHIDDLFDAISFVMDNNTGSDYVIKSIQKFIDSLETKEEKELAKSILIKDLPIGISKTTINKVYGKNFIPVHKVMTAERYSEKSLKDGEEFTLTLKLDGNRATIFNYVHRGPVIVARSGKKIEGLTELIEEFKKLPQKFVYDGEIVAENPDNLSSKELFQKTQKILRNKGDKKGLNFFVFDALPISEFNEGKSKQIYNDRMNWLNETLEKQSLLRIKKVPTYYTGTNQDMIPLLLNKVIKSGGEGLMINKNNGLYQKKRVKDLLKVKKFYTLDLKVIGVKEDIRGGRAGSLTCEYKDSTVDVAGLKDKEKEYFWNHPEEIIGKIIEVKYFEETKNQNGTLSLRFPNFVRIRTDKDDVSYA